MGSGSCIIRTKAFMKVIGKTTNPTATVETSSSPKRRTWSVKLTKGSSSKVWLMVKGPIIMMMDRAMLGTGLMIRKLVTVRLCGRMEINTRVIFKTV